MSFAVRRENFPEFAIESFFRTFRFHTVQPSLSQLHPEFLVPVELDTLLRKGSCVSANEEFGAVFPPKLCCNQRCSDDGQTSRRRFMNLVRNPSGVPGGCDEDARIGIQLRQIRKGPRFEPTVLQICRMRPEVLYPATVNSTSDPKAVWINGKTSSRNQISESPLGESS